jgi:pimeloyl-[acyl-carrier protein] methyl ester esterase
MKVHVERAGSGPDLVLLHGWALHSGVWDDLRPELAKRFRVHAVDLPGHGASAAHGAGSFPEACEDVAGAIPPGAIVCGWSLGGLVAQHVAAGHPSRVARLVLVATTPSFATRPGWAAAMAPATLAAFADGLHRDRDRTLRDFVHLNALHGVHAREAVRALARRLSERGAPPLQALDATLAWLRDTDLRDAAAALAMPALVVHGARDALAPVEAGRWLARELPDARLEEIDDAAHLPFFTHRERFVRALESFVG